MTRHLYHIKKQSLEKWHTIFMLFFKAFFKKRGDNFSICSKIVTFAENLKSKEQK